MTKIQNGQAEYGVVHVTENAMREAGEGVFEEKSSEVGRKALGAAPKNKMDDAPQNKGLSGLSKAELIDQAEAEGVELDDGDTKAEITAKIEKARG